MKKAQVALEAITAVSILALILIFSIYYSFTSTNLIEEKNSDSGNLKDCRKISDALSLAFNSEKNIELEVTLKDKNIYIGDDFVLVNDVNQGIDENNFSSCSHYALTVNQGYYNNKIKIQKKDNDLNVFQE